MEKTDLIPGIIYHVSCPKFNMAVWTGEVFKGPGLVDGSLTFVFAGHFEDGLPNGIATPLYALSDVCVRSPYDGYNFLVAMNTLNEIAIP